MVRGRSLLNYFASKTQSILPRCLFLATGNKKNSSSGTATAIAYNLNEYPADDWLKTGWAKDSQTYTQLVDSLICIMCSLENNGFSVLHCVINITLHYYKINVTLTQDFSASGTIAHSSIRLSPFSLVSLRGCLLAITLESSSQVKHYYPQLYMYINLHSINELIIWKLNL